MLLWGQLHQQKMKAYSMTRSHLGYDGPGSGMYRFLCKSPAPKKVQLSTYTVSQDLSGVG